MKVRNNFHPPPHKNHESCGLVGAICDICHKQFYSDAKYFLSRSSKTYEIRYSVRKL